MRLYGDEKVSDEDCCGGVCWDGWEMLGSGSEARCNGTRGMGWDW